MNKQPNGNLGISIVRPVMVGIMDGTALRHESKAIGPRFNTDGLVIWMDLTGDLINQGSASTLQGEHLGSGTQFAPDKWGDTTGALQNQWYSHGTFMNANSSVDTKGGFSICWWQREFIDVGSGTQYIHRLYCDETFSFYIIRQAGYGSGGSNRLAIYMVTSGGFEGVDSSIGTYFGDDMQWHHYAITHNSSTNTIKFYVDGICISEKILTTATGVIYPSGAGTNPKFVFGGYSDNTLDACTMQYARLSYWHRVLAPNEVATIFNNGDDFRFKDLNIPTNRLKDGLISHWTLDESSGIRLDSHGTNHLIENLGVVESRVGKLGNAANFSAGGINQPQLECPSNNSLRLSNDQAFTLSAWFYFDGNSNYPSFISKTSSGTGATAGFNIGHHVSFGGLAFYVGNGSTLGSVTAPYLPWHEWTHVIAWHDPDANTMNICINGETVYSNSWSGGTYTDSAPFVIGGNYLSPIYSSTVDTDEVSFWKRVLTPEERKVLFNNGEPLPYFKYSDPTTNAEDLMDPTLEGWWKFGQDDGAIVKDISGNDRHLRIYGSPTWENGYLNTDFGDYAQSPDWYGPQGTDSFSISFWVTRESQSEWAFPVSNGNWAENGFYIQIDASGYLTFVSGSTSTVMSGDNYLPPNTWTHFMLVKDTSWVNFYVNGVYIGGASARLDMLSAPYKFTLTGVANGAAGGLNGGIDDVRLYNDLKSASFAARLFAQGRNSNI